MTKETYEIVIETLAKELELERWRREEAEKELEAEKKRCDSLCKYIEDLRKGLENG